MNETNLKEFKNKKILITGGVGSIGIELVRTLIHYSPKVLRVLDNNETGLFDLQQELIDYKFVRILVGDIRDKERLIKAMEDIDIVFHAAALKHVPLCEYNPFEAVKTNILGTQNLIDAAFLANVDKVVVISTDKAISPINVMGATKLLSERLTIAANYSKGYKRTKFSCVRFGNVMGSRGSVIPLFLNQIELNGSISVTDQKMTRFIMKIEEAVFLILQTVNFMAGGEIFVLKMPSIKILDLAKVLTKKYCEKNNLEYDSIKTNIIGSREGERFEEFLISQDEFILSSIYEIENLFVIISNPTYFEFNNNILETFSDIKQIKEFRNEFSSETCKKLDNNELSQFLNDFI